MSVETAAKTRRGVAWLLAMSDCCVSLRMRAGDLPRPGRPKPKYVAAFVRYQVAAHG